MKSQRTTTGKLSVSSFPQSTFGKTVAASAALASLLPLATVAGYKIMVNKGCSNFFKQATTAFDAPGLDEGFIPQDLVYSKTADCFFFSGYSNDETKSPLYVCPKGKNPYPLFVTLPDGSLYRGHGAAVAANGDRLFLTTDTGFMILSLDEVLSARPAGAVSACGHRSVDLTPAFMGIYGDILYLGVFYYPWLFATPSRMHFTTPGGQHNHAVMYAFRRQSSDPSTFEEHPFAVYSIPDKVQGLAVLPDGRFVFSCSFFFNNSHLLVHDARNMTPDGTYAAQWTSVPRFDLDDRTLSRDIVAPPMAEGITLYDNKVYITFESASKRYKIGALTQGRRVFALPMDLFGQAAQHI